MYPQPTDPNAAPGDFNFHKAVLNKTTGRQFDIKLDHNFSDRNHVSGRYSNLHSENAIPTIFGDGDWGCCGDGFSGVTDVHNASLDEDFTVTPNMVWTNRFALDRASSPVTENYPKFSTVFDQPGDAVLGQANHLDRFPTIQMDNNATTSLFNQCCTDTGFAHTLYSYSSALSWAKGRQIWKFGGEQRLFFNNFFQPGNPTGLFNFTQERNRTSDWHRGSHTGRRVRELAAGIRQFGFVPGRFRIRGQQVKGDGILFSGRLEGDLEAHLESGSALRMEHALHGAEQPGPVQQFYGDTGVAVPINVADPNRQHWPVTLVNRTGNLLGTTEFPTSGHRNVPVDRNNWAPRVGFAYAVGSNTVVRGGAGIYYGLNVATNFQTPGPAFGSSNPIRFTKDNFQTQFATLADPFPAPRDMPSRKAIRMESSPCGVLSDNNCLGCNPRPQR